MNPIESQKSGYDDLFQDFDSPLMKRLREEAYGQDIGQHSWVTAEELAADVSRLNLSAASRILDLGCGPGGPLSFIINRVGCKGTGIDLSDRAIAAAQARMARQGLETQAMLRQADLEEPLPFSSRSFDAVVSFDVILHLRDRTAVFGEIARTLVPGGRFLFTDGAVLVGSIAAEEVQTRAAHGSVHFVAPGFNERALEHAGFRLVESCDRTSSLLKNARGRRTARLSHREELEAIEGRAGFEREQQFLDTVIRLSEKGAVARMMYLAESRRAPESA